RLGQSDGRSEARHDQGRHVVRVHGGGTMTTMTRGLAIVATASMAVLLLAFAAARAGAASPPLRVCADPNNLPFSNARQQGFENRLAAMVAGDLGTRIEYVWSAQRRGFLRQTLNAGTCDVVMGVPAGLPQVATTRPYYRSSYVFVEPHGI